MIANIFGEKNDTLQVLNSAKRLYVNEFAGVVGNQEFYDKWRDLGYEK